MPQNIRAAAPKPLFLTLMELACSVMMSGLLRRQVHKKCDDLTVASWQCVKLTCYQTIIPVWVCGSGTHDVKLELRKFYT